MGSKESDGTGAYPSFFHFLGAFLITALVIAASLATIITILLRGLPILQHGLPMCKLLADEGMLGRLLYTSCGCALVEIILFPLAVAGLMRFAPKLFRQFAYARQAGKKLVK